MNRLTWVILTLIMLYTPIIFSQSEYLDTSFGDNGIVRLDTSSALDHYNQISFDDDGRIYLTFHNDQYDYLGTGRLNQDGSPDYIFADNGILIPDSSSPYSSFRQEKNYIIEHVQSLQIIRLYDREANLLSELNVTASEGYFFVSSIGPSNNLIVSNKEQMAVYNLNGEPLTSFGNNGVLHFNEVISDSGNVVIVRQLKDHSFIFSSFWDTALTESQVTKLTPTGELDTSFGNGGHLKLPESIFAFQFDENQEDNLIIHTLGRDTSCLLILDYDVFGFHKNGQINTSFGNEGLLENNDDCLSFNFSYNSTYFSDGQILVPFHNYSQSESELFFDNSSLKLFTKDGKTKNDFEDEGELIIDFIADQQIIDLAIDKNDNVFILTTDTQYKVPYLLKLSADHFIEKPTGSSEDNYFSLYNNPSKGDFTLAYSGPGNEGISIKLYDMMGRLIASKKYDVLNSGEQIQFNEEALVPAGYIIKVSSRNESTLFSGKILVLE